MTKAKKKMKNKTVFLIVLLLLSMPSFANNKEEHNQFHWTINLEGVTYRLSEDNGWGFGPGLKLSFNLSGKFGIQAGAYWLPTSNGGYTFRGFALDGGIRYHLSHKTPQFTFEAGLCHVFGNDSDGTDLLAFGIYAGASATWWLTKHIGLCGRSTLRLWFKDDNYRHSYPNGLGASFSGGFAMRF